MLTSTELQNSSDEELAQVVRSVFDTMLGLEVEPSPGDMALQSGVLTAIVFVTGQHAGAVVIHCPYYQACRFTGRFLGKVPPASVNDDVLDVLGELANMVAGNLKRRLLPGAHLSIPSVIEGSDAILTLLWRTAHRRVFDTEVGAFGISIVVSQPPEQQQLSEPQQRAADFSKRVP